MLLGIEAAHANKRDRTGVEEYCFQIIQALKQTVPADVRVVLYSNEPLRGGLEDLPQNWESKVLRWPLKKLWSQTRLAVELLQNPPDIFFAPGQLLPWSAPRGKSFVTVHDSAFLAFPQAFSFWGRQYLKVMQWWVVTRAARIITPSEYSREELKYFFSKLNLHKTTVIPHGFEGVYAMQEANASVPVRFGITKPYIISVGRLEEKKNTRRIVEAFTKLKQSQNIQLVLVGKPRVGSEEVFQMIEKSPYKQDIILPGFVPTQEVSHLLKQAKVCVFPSLHEGFGLPLLESMAAGCPVVTSSGTALPEVGGDAVLYADPNRSDEIAKQVETLLTDDSLRSRMVKKGYDRVHHFSWQKSAKMTWESIANFR